MLSRIQQPVVCPVLIGRGSEMAALQSLVEKVARGEGRVVSLSGEAGIGKSRLTIEARRSASDRGFRLLEGRCYPTDRAYPYAPLRDLLRAFLSRLSPAEAATTLGPSAHALSALLPERVQRLLDTVDLPSPLLDLDPEQEKRHLFAALVDFFLRQAESAPALVLIEDVHWSDESTLEFLLLLGRQCAEHRLLLVMTYRSDEAQQPLRHLLAELDRERLRQEIVLVPLTRAESNAMLAATLHVTPHSPAGLSDALYNLTEGNPFFLEEALKALITSDELSWAGDGWRWTHSDSWRIPLTVQDAVQLRLDALSAGARRVVRLAAVAGRRFDFALLQQITQYSEGSLLELLKELVTAQLVIEESADQFAFRHALTHQAIAAGLLARERRVLHRIVAQTMEQLSIGSLDARLSDLAYHFAEGELWEQSLIYAQRAAEQAQKLFYAPRAAVEQWTRALQAARNLGQAAPPGYYRARGQAWETLGDFEEARADYERALQAAGQMGDARSQWQSMLDLGFLWAGRDYERTGTYFKRAVELAGTLGDASLQAHSLNRLGNWLLNTGQFDSALESHHKALALFETLQDSAGMAETLDLLGTMTCHAGDVANGVLLYGRAIDLLRTIDNRSVLSSCLAMRASFASPWNGHVTCTLNWSFEECERGAIEAAQLARDIQWVPGETFAEIMRGIVCMSFGKLGAGLAHSEEGLRLATEINHQQWLACAHYALACIYLIMYMPERAASHIEVGLAGARELRSAYWIANFVATQVHFYRLQEQPDLAEAVLQEVLARTEDPDEGLGRELLLARAEVALAKHRPENALQWCEQLLRTASQRAGESEELVIPHLWKCQGEALAALGRTEESIQVLTDARRGAVLQNYWPLYWEIERSLGRVYWKQKRYKEAQQAFASARRVIDTLAESIEDAALREPFVRAALATLPKEKLISSRRATARQYGGLTERERDVAAQIGQGKSNAEIAGSLMVSRRTVETYVSNVLSKLSFTSRSQIALWARDQGLTGRQQ